MSEIIRDESITELSTAITELEGIKQEIMQSGAVDSEIIEIDKIYKEIINLKVTPEEGLEQARMIQMNRQDYH